MSTAYTRVAQRERGTADNIKFEPLLTDGDDDDQFIIKSTKTKSHHAAWMLSPVWVCSTFALLVLLLAQNVYFWSTHSYSYERGYSTELGSLLPCFVHPPCHLLISPQMPSSRP